MQGLDRRKETFLCACRSCGWKCSYLRADLFGLPEKQDKDPDDPRSARQNHRPRRQKVARVQRQAARRGPPANRPQRNQNRLGWLKRRTRQVTRMPFPILSFVVAPDSRTIVFVTTEPAGTASVPVIYSIQDDGRRLTRVTSDNRQTKAAKVGQVVAAVLVAEFPISRFARWLHSLFQ